MELNSKQPFPHFRFITNGRFMKFFLNPEQEDIKSRWNKINTHYALVRGDNQVVLEYDPQPAQSLIDHVNRRRIVRPSLPPAVEYSEAYGHLWHPNEHGDNHQVTELPYELGVFWSTHRTWDGFHLNWVKILGQGGFGVATLWEAIFEDGTSCMVVIKMPRPKPGGHTEDLRREVSWHRKYAGALHTVQVVDLNEIVRGKRYYYAQGGAGPPRIRGPIFNPRHLNVSVLEYAQHGNLFDMLAKISYSTTRLSNKVLWELWECLVRGVASVSRQRGILQQDLMPGVKYGLDEVLASIEGGAPVTAWDFLHDVIDSHDVHFDLEEQNVLIAAHPSHYGSPLLKARLRSSVLDNWLHDFGGSYSFEMQDCWKRWRFVNYMRARSSPKLNRRLPEQATREWEDFDALNSPSADHFRGQNLDRGTPVAGRYGTWSNIFLIASIMESIITDRWISCPFTKYSYVTADGMKAAETYAHRLLHPDYSWVEPELLEQVIRCQFHQPADRPNITELLFVCVRRKMRGFPEESNDETARFWYNFWLPLPEDNVGMAPDSGQDNGDGNDAGEAAQGEDKGKAPQVELPADFFDDPAAHQDKMPGVETKDWSNVKDLIANLVSAAERQGPKAMRHLTVSDAGFQPDRPGIDADREVGSDPGQPGAGWKPPPSSEGPSPQIGESRHASSGSGHDSGPAWSQDGARSAPKPKGDSWPYLGKLRYGSSPSSGSGNSGSRVSRRSQRPRPGSAPGRFPSVAMRNLASRADQLQSYLDQEMVTGDQGTTAEDQEVASSDPDKGGGTSLGMHM
ncbi:hypothetical protein PLIIFM63780_002869 [Purpureocillium lilacinum]|nr:hypothetical protein PLIIFM63780_002869 [Purpureocillium lilacinum]